MTADLQTALQLAGEGFRVFPLEPNSKRPAFPQWQHNATSDPERIDRWWRDPVLGWEANWGVGIATGGGLVVVDLDTKHDGPRAFELLADLHSELPATLKVRTPSGGQHLYFKTGRSLRNSASKIAKGVDIRGEGGYVVAPGTTVGGRSYERDGGGSVGSIPEWLADLAGEARAKPDRTCDPSIELDTHAAIERAIEYLSEAAPAAVEGAGGDATTYSVAARVKDFGISEPQALELLLDHWNDQCAPPWLPEDLERKVANAYSYGNSAPGAANPMADFEPVELGAAGAAPDEADRGQRIPVLRLHDLDEGDIPPRRWLLGTTLLCGKVASLIAPGGVGKSTISVQWAFAVITGRDDVAGLTPHETGAVWIVNCEDDNDELRRRIAAVRRHFNVDWSTVRDNLHVTGGADRQIKVIARRADGRLARTKDVARVVSYIVEHGVKLLVVDPLVETHEANENDNAEMKEVLAVYRSIATQTGCAVAIIHHSRKPSAGSAEGHAGNADSGRGASAVVNSVRVAATLYSMDKKDGDAFGIGEDERLDYVRLDDAKANFARRGSARWFRRVSVQLSNGDSVGILEPVALTARREAATAVEENRLAVLAEAAAAVVPASEDRVSLSSIATRLRQEQPDLPSRPTVIGDLEKAFSLPRQVGPHVWQYRNEKVPGQQAEKWLVRAEAAEGVQA